MMLPYLLFVLTFVGSVIPHHKDSPVFIDDDSNSWSNSESCEDDSEEKQCGENEYLNSCAPVCPYQTCVSRPCGPEPGGRPCMPGCRCLDGFLRNASGKCIPESQCDSEEKQCGENEYLNSCAPVCPYQTCVSRPCGPEPRGRPCIPGCRCLDGFLRNASGKCIPESQCEHKPCPPRCRPTCSIPNPKNCRKNPACNGCPAGSIYVDRRNTTCIPIYQCPPKAGCNGDKNAVIRNLLIGCPPTCRKPNQNGCNKPDQLGCACKSGYILNRKNSGRCIPINKCPGGNPCGRNQTFVSCTQCIFDACPTGSLIRYPCDPTFPCPAGCVCASGYRRLNEQCILASDCPPVPDIDPTL